MFFGKISIAVLLKTYNVELPVILQADAEVFSPLIVILSIASGQLVGITTKQLVCPEWISDVLLQFPSPFQDILSLQTQDGISRIYEKTLF